MRAVTFATVRDIGLTLPETEVSTYYGTPALKVRGEMYVCMASHSSAEPGTLVVRMPFDKREALLAEGGAAYYLKPHYAGYPSILVRLSRVGTGELRDLLQSAWRLALTAKRRRRSRRGAKTRGRAR